MSDSQEQTRNVEVPVAPLADKLPTRETLGDWSMRLLQRGNSPTQCDIYEISHEGRTLLLKDGSRHWKIVRWLLVRPILRREYWFLDHLAGQVRVPALFGWLDADAILMERINGEAMPGRRHRDRVAAEFFARLLTEVDRLHEAGVVHGDMRRKNILIDATGKPCLIDFATAWSHATWFGRFMNARLRGVDRLKVLRLKADYRPESVTAAERAQLDHLPWTLKLGRFLKHRVYKRLRGRA